MDPFIWILVALLTFFCVCFLGFKPKGLPPGPFAWPIVGSALSLQHPLYKHYTKLGLKYGPLVYLKVGAARVLVVNSSEVAKELLTARDLAFASRPPSRLYKIISLGNRDISFSDFSESTRNLRKTSNHYLFRPHRLNETASTRESELRSVVFSIASKGVDFDIDMREILGEYAANVIWLMLFGKKPASATKVTELVDRIVGFILAVNIGELVPALDRFDLHGVYKNLEKILPQLTGLINQMIQDGRQEDCEGGTSCIFDAPLSDTSITALLINLIIGGIGSTQTTLEWAMAELLIGDLSVMTKAQQELDTVVGQERLVKESDISELSYIQAIINETLRLHPPGPLGFPHYNQRATTLAGYNIPAKCQVLINIWAIGRDPKYWEDPGVFKPERFLDPNAGKCFEMIPFSAGRRMCPGFPMAMRSGPLILATLLHAFNWTTSCHSLEEATQPTMGLDLGSKLVARAKPRLKETVYSTPL